MRSPSTSVPQDPLLFLRALETSDHFRRDSTLGGIFHPGKISFREVSPTDSLHVLIDGNQISAHVDTISPLRIAGDGSVHYSWSRVVAHNLWAAAGDVVRRLFRRRGEQRCNLTCEIEWVDDDVTEPTGDCDRFVDCDHSVSQASALLDDLADKAIAMGE